MQQKLNRPIRVLHIITRLIVGGAQENTLLSAIGLQNRKDYIVTLLSGPAIGPEGSLLKQAQEKISDFVVLPTLRRNINLFLDLISFFRLYIFIKKRGFDIVHTHSSKAGILGRIAAKLANVPTIVHTVHGLPFFKEQNFFLNYVYLNLEKFTCRFTDKIICVSQQLINTSVKAGLGPEEKFVKIYSGIDLTLFKENPDACRSLKRKLHIPEDCLVIGKIARFFFLKGHEYLLEAAVKIKPEIPNLRILLIGDGVLKDKFIEQVQKLGLEKNVVFVGLLPPEKIPYYIQIFDVLAHTSLHEGLPRVVVQGFALGKPAVCFDIDGARDIVMDNINGFLIEPKNIIQLSMRLIELLKNKKKAEKMGQEGKQIVMENFSAEGMVASIDFVYRQLLSCGN